MAIFNQDWEEDASAQRVACLEHASTAVRLDATDSRCHRILAMILLESREFERAAYHARHFYQDARLAACHAAVGRMEEARRVVARALAAKPDFSSAAWTATLPFRNEADRERLRAELVAAGLPP